MTTHEEVFDLEQVYDDQISPLMAKILAICKEHQLPMVASFAYTRQPDDAEETGYGYCTSYVTFDGRRPEPLVRAYNIIYEPHRSQLLAITIQGAGKP